MKIAHVVTLISPDNAYGGPTRVAMNLARAQRSMGHDVTILASTRGYESGARETDGIPTRLFRSAQLIPGAGFAGMFAPGLLGFLFRHIRDYDAIHVHLARDLITLPAAAIAGMSGVPYAAQTHGMIDSSERWAARLLDVLLTRRVLRRARVVFFLTPREQLDLQLVARKSPISLRHLPNAVPVPAMSDEGPAADSGELEVLYLARLAHRKRPLMFVDIAERLAAQFPTVRWRLVGPDEGEAEAVRRRIAGVNADVHWEGPLPVDRTSARMSRASVLVLPSINEPFPMSVLEAMAVGLPVVITESCGLAYLEEQGALAVAQDTLDSLVIAVSSLLASTETRRAMGARAREVVKRDHSPAAIGAMAISALGLDRSR